MSHALVIANIERAGDHAAVFGVLLAAAVIGGLVYGLIRLVARSRAGRSPSIRDPNRDRWPGA